MLLFLRLSLHLFPELLLQLFLPELPMVGGFVLDGRVQASAEEQENIEGPTEANLLAHHGSHLHEIKWDGEKGNTPYLELLS